MPKDGQLRTNALLSLSLFDSVIDDDHPDAYNDEDCFDHDAMIMMMMKNHKAG